MSTFREIEEVYLEDIIKKQKMTKSIVAESIGELMSLDREDAYFILDEKSNAVKIGISWFIEKRLRAIQSCNPNKLKIIAIIPCGDENELHCKFEDFWIHGEWFKYEGELKSYIEKLPKFVKHD